MELTAPDAAPPLAKRDVLRGLQKAAVSFQFCRGKTHVGPIKFVTVVATMNRVWSTLVRPIAFLASKSPGNQDVPDSKRCLRSCRSEVKGIPTRSPESAQWRGNSRMNKPSARNVPRAEACSKLARRHHNFDRHRGPSRRRTTVVRRRRSSDAGTDAEERDSAA